jgi:hypothetical protein
MMQLYQCYVSVMYWESFPTSYLRKFHVFIRRYLKELRRASGVRRTSGRRAGSEERAAALKVAADHGQTGPARVGVRR